MQKQTYTALVAAIFIYPAAKAPTQNGLPKALVSWSGGKDSAWALQVLRERGEVQVVGLLTTVNEAFRRVAMHAIRVELLRAQAEAVGLPLWEVELSHPCSNEHYDAAMSQAMTHARREGLSSVAFGDLSLKDVRRYREDRMRGTGIEPIFPLWGQPTRELSRAMLAAGVRARFTCVDPKQIPATFAGRAYDQGSIDELPATADPCGERGEFHTFVHDGPMFSRPIPVRTGEVVERDGFVFADMIPA